MGFCQWVMWKECIWSVPPPSHNNQRSGFFERLSWFSGMSGPWKFFFRSALFRTAGKVPLFLEHSAHHIVPLHFPIFAAFYLSPFLKNPKLWSAADPPAGPFNYKHRRLPFQSKAGCLTVFFLILSLPPNVFDKVCLKLSSGYQRCFLELPFVS